MKHAQKQHKLKHVTIGEKTTQKSDKEGAESGKALAGNDEKKAKRSKHDPKTKNAKSEKEVPEGIHHSQKH